MPERYPDTRDVARPPIQLTSPVLVLLSEMLKLELVDQEAPPYVAPMAVNDENMRIREPSATQYIISIK